jgi:quaternary ammonium compound-resistance protein SugE
MAWTFLILAGACEMVWPLGFKYTRGFSAHYWAVGGTFAIMVLSLYLMSLATKHGVPVGLKFLAPPAQGASGAVPVAAK